MKWALVKRSPFRPQFWIKTKMSPLPNSRIRLIDDVKAPEIKGFSRAARHLQLEGYFHVNLNSPGAWKALLSVNRRSDGVTPFSRHLKAPGPQRMQGDDADSDAMWGAYTSFRIVRLIA